MLIIGCDFHPGFQQVAIIDNRTGAIQERRLPHREEAEQFYEPWSCSSQPIYSLRSANVVMQSSGVRLSRSKALAESTARVRTLRVRTSMTEGGQADYRK